MNKLKELEACGQSLWLDYLRRSLIESGELRVLIERDGLKGVTSNPSIFEKAIGETDEYADALEQFQPYADHNISEKIYEHMAIADIRAAADVLRPVYDQTHGRDGYISLECSPYLANDFEATVSEARRLWAEVNRPNLMVKVPATPSGIPAIRQLTSDGLNINITLLFSVDVYEQVVDAYLSGLEDLSRAGGDISKIASVASIFVSRIDTAIDKRLDELRDKRAGLLRGKVGIANAKIAYARYKELFSAPRWQVLAASGAKTQRLLWASTGVKDPAYKHTMYVEALIGRDSVTTVPPATMDSFRHHGTVTPDAIEQDVESARAVLNDLEQLGVSLDEVTEELVKDGVQKFVDAFDKLFGSIARRREMLLERKHAHQVVKPASPEIRAAVDG
jgi:transaldolase/glucose-6-phosphate isomerase